MLAHHETETAGLLGGMRTGEELLAAAVSRGAGEGERAEALEQLWRERSSQLVPAIKALSSPPPPPGLAGVLYKMARELPIEVLMRCEPQRP